jgi:hypothetical protein
MPSGWAPSRGARLVSGGAGTLVTTTPGSGIQLQSSEMRLKTAVYRVLVDGRVLSGGLQVGVEPSRGTGCEAASYFDASSTTPRRPLLRVYFRSHRERPVKIVLRNWSNGGEPSRWQLHAVQLVAVPPSKQLATVYRKRASPLVDMKKLPVVTHISRWTFARAGSAPWTVVPSTRIDKSGSLLRVQTSPDRYAYALTVRVRLEPGSYLLRFDGKILQGGLSLGVIDARRNAWIAERFYWYGQSSKAGAMATRFTFLRWGEVQLVLGNWAPTPAASKWLLRSVELVRLVLTTH